MILVPKKTSQFTAAIRVRSSALKILRLKQATGGPKFVG
jgi:hypothetical protein